MKDLYVFATERDAMECRRLYPQAHARTSADLVRWAATQELGDVYVDPATHLTAYERDALRRRQVKPAAVLIDDDAARWQAALDRLRGRG